MPSLAKNDTSRGENLLRTLPGSIQAFRASQRTQPQQENEPTGTGQQQLLQGISSWNKIRHHPRHGNAFHGQTTHRKSDNLLSESRLQKRLRIRQGHSETLRSLHLYEQRRERNRPREKGKVLPNDRKTTADLSRLVHESETPREKRGSTKNLRDC